MTIELQDKLYTSTQVADILGVSLRTLYRYMEDGRIQSMRTASGRHRFTKDQIIDFLNAGNLSPLDIERPSSYVTRNDSQPMQGNNNLNQVPPTSQFSNQNFGQYNNQAGQQSPYIDSNTNYGNVAPVGQPAVSTMPETFMPQQPVHAPNNDNFLNNSFFNSSNNVTQTMAPANDPFADFDDEPLDINSNNPVGQNNQVNFGNPLNAENPLNVANPFNEFGPTNVNEPTVPNPAKFNSDFDFSDSIDEPKFETPVQRKVEETPNDFRNEFKEVYREVEVRTQQNQVPEPVRQQSQFQPATHPQPTPQPQQAAQPQPGGFGLGMPQQQPAAPELVDLGSHLNIRYYKSEHSDLIELARKIKDVSKSRDLEYAFTLYAGLSLHFLIDPFTILHFYANPEDMQIWKEDLKLSPVSRKEDANVGVIINTDIVFAPTREIATFKVVEDKILLRDLSEVREENLIRKFREQLNS